MKSILITSGDPAGCGPAITCDAIARLAKMPLDFLVVGDREVFERLPGYSRVRDRCAFVDAKTPGIRRLETGYPTSLSGRAALNYLDCALAVIRARKIARLVTAPLSKEAVQIHAPRFLGHTEYLAAHYAARDVHMLMASPELKVILFTRHCPLREVPGRIRCALLARALTKIHQEIKKLFKISKPRLAVASLNPHAGLNTYLEREDEIVRKAILASGGHAEGPYPADTIFLPQNRKRYDCIVCLYHDQGMLPFKLLSFECGVNVTLGLPVIRTSPAHGTAFDLVRLRKPASSASMIEAITLAARLTP